MLKWIVLALVSGVAGADTDFCFESDKRDVDARTLWSHHHFVLRSELPQIGPGGRVFRALRGAGWNDAPTPNGSSDLVGLMGAAIKDSDGTWLVSLTGTLLQQSTLYISDHKGIPPYWLITQNWILDMAAENGIGHYGNLTREFGQFENSKNDSVDTLVWRVSCAE